MNTTKLSDKTQRKFIESYDVDEWEIETDAGWSDISHIHLTEEYCVWTVKTESGKILECADTHILFDQDLNEIYAKDCIPGNTQIQTKDGPEKVTTVIESTYKENMYDLSLDDENHRFYTNDILSHNSTCLAAFILHYILFNKSKTVGILANKKDTSVEILSRVQKAYQHLPKFIQQGVVEFNKGSFVLENGSRVLAAATASSSVRGYSFSLLFVDEVAFIQPSVFNEFYKSTYPTISSGKETKVVLVSTPNGMNHFYKLWTDAEDGRNSFTPHKVSWEQVPGRDEKWKQETIANTSEQDFAQEHALSFLGSANTLVATWKLKQMGYKHPLYEKDGVTVYHKPDPSHVYVGVCDVAEGVGGDYSTMTVFDISGDSGYRIAATFRDNSISTLLFPDVIHKLATEYNDAYLLIETNSIGKQVADVLHAEFEYENILMTTSGGRKGQTVSSGFGSAGGRLGVKTTTPVRRIGCSTLKTLIEENKLIIESYDIVSELATFVFYKGKYQAEVGHHDDLTMTLVLFAWLTQQQYFRDMADMNIREELYADKIKAIEADLTPFGFIDDGRDLDNDDLPGNWERADFMFH